MSDIPAGAYNVTYIPPTGFRTTAATVNPRSTNVTGGQTASTSFAVESSVSGPNLVFTSDWHVATGTSGAAKSNGGQWDLSVDGGGPADRIAVVSAAGLAFPAGMANVLRVLHDVANEDSYWNVLIEDGWPLPPIGGSLFKRMYFRYDVAGSGGGDMHAVQTGPPGNCPYTAEWMFARRGTTQVDFALAHYGGSGSNSNQHHWLLQFPLGRGQTYRVEEQFIRQGTNSWRVHARIYDAANTLIAQDADFTCDYHPAHTMGSYTGNITSGTDCLRNAMIGYPGQTGKGSSDPAHQHIYYGGFAVSITDWCGPYIAGEEV
jgi:hypothetical protein